MGTTETVAKWVAETSFETIPPDAVRVAREACFDCIGVMLAGTTQPAGQIITKYTRETGGTPESTVVGTGIKTSATMAALANGTSAHALDFDDVGGWGHPTTVLLPTVLAMGEKVGASGRDILEAYIVGMEVSCNLSLGAHYNQMTRGFHSTAIFGALAATCAAAKLLKLSVPQIVTALGIAGSEASGSIHNFGTMTKPLHAGMAARNGVMAALLAKDGFTAGEQILESNAGFANTFFGEGVYNLEEMVKGLGNPFRTQDVVAIKKYPCCYGNHSMLDALLGLLKENNLSYDDIVNVHIENQSYLSPVMMYTEPGKGLEGKFSIQYNAAAAILDQAITINTFTDEKVREPKVKEALGKVSVDVLPRWDSRLGQGWGLHNPVTLTLKDGRSVSKGVTRPEIRGTQETPLTAEELEGKFRDNARLVLSDASIDKAVQAWKNLDQLGDLKEASGAVAG